MQLKVLYGLASDCVYMRQKRNKYETNRAIKAFGMYIILKNITTSGIVQNPFQQSTYLEGIFKTSFRTLRRWAIEAESLGLIEQTIENGAISCWKLTSIKKVCELYDLNIKYHSIEYDVNDQQKTIEYYLKALEIYENKEKQAKAFETKISKKPALKMAIQQLSGNQEPKEANSQRAQLQKFQASTFTHGIPSLEVYQMIQDTANPNFDRSAKGFRKAYKFKSNLSVTYLRRQLETRGFISLSRPKPIVCLYNALDNQIKGRKRHVFRRYDQTNQIATWWLPIEVNLLIKPAPLLVGTKL